MLPPASHAAAQQPAASVGAVPHLAAPIAIEGLDVRTSPLVEFSHAWLGKADGVRRRRAELMAAGRLDRAEPALLASLGGALAGELRVPVIPIRYSDVPAPFPVGALVDRLFGQPRGDTMSYAGYWREVSGGLLRVTGSVASWITLSRKASYYLPESDYGWASFGRMRELRDEALAAADPAFDFGEFDNDGPDGVPNSGDDDGYVDFVALLYASRCGAGAAQAGAIWPHRGAASPYETNDPAAAGGRIKVTDYVIQPAMDARTCGPTHIGVLAHETGHAFGLPDLYDYDGSSQGIGAWGLMGTGSHAEDFSPAHPSAWEKEQLGWVRVDWLREPYASLRIPAVERDARIFRYDVPETPGVYALLENRQRIGSDARIPGSGLLVWRIDPERGELGAWNSDERWSAVRLIAADARDDLGRGGDADSEDPYPGDDGRRSLRSAAIPGFRLASILEWRGDVFVEAMTGDTAPVEPDVRYADLTEPSRERAGRRGNRPEVVATGLPWSWGISADAGRVVQASLGWDPLGMRPRPRLLQLSESDPQPATLARLPAEAVFSPAPAPDGGSYVLAMARGRSYLYRVAPGGAAELVSSDLGAAPAYGVATLPDGTVAVSDWSGRIRRIGPEGEPVRWIESADRFYQISAAPDGTLFAATWSGDVLRVAPDGSTARLRSGFESGRLVAVSAAADGSVYAAERGGEGRVIRIARNGKVSRIGRVKGAEFYGLAVDGSDLYAADLAHRELLRFRIGSQARR